MNSASFGLLLDYLKKTNSRILMPLIVYRELGEIYKGKLCARSAEYEWARRSLEKALVDTHIPRIEIDISSEVTKYLEFIQTKLNVRDKEIVPFRGTYLDELVTRAVTRVKPFTDKGEEFRDALLWLTVLDIARDATEETLAFISNDTKAFGQNHQLHEDLFREVEATGKQVSYYNSISKFIESHATHVEYITRNWLFSVIDFETFAEIVTERLGEYLAHLDEYDLGQRGWEGLEFTGYLSPTGTVTEDNITEHYVYEKSDGSLYVQANYYIEYEVEFTSKERVKADRFLGHSWEARDYDDDYDNDDYDEKYVIKTKAVYKYPEVEVIFGIMVKDKQVINVELTGCYV